MAMTKVKNLQLWCKKMAEGYRDVEVRDMASSWRSGLAFCAIIHRFRPDLIDYDSLSKENVFENNNLAFEVAEKQLSIPAFLEAQDMEAYKVPDKLSVITYVSQYYNYFHNKPQLGGPGVNEFKKGVKKKDSVKNNDQKTLSPTHINTEKTMTQKDRQDSMADKCSLCHEKVYLLERHIENGKLYHRSCYRRSELSPQSRLSKRHQQRSKDGESKESGKFRKLDQNKNESNNQNTNSGSDFWQRRAEAKAQEVASHLGNQNSNSATKVDDTPSWKKTELSSNLGPRINEDTNKDVVMISPNLKPKFDKAENHFGQSKQNDGAAKPNKLADKFKELNERNLKSSHYDQSVAKSVNDKETKDACYGLKSVTSELGADHKLTGKNEQKTPVAKPRINVLGRAEKMDTSESPAVAAPRPRPVPRFKVTVPPKTGQDNVSSDKTSSETNKEINRQKTPLTKGSDISLPSTGYDQGKSKTPPNKRKEMSKPASPSQRPKSELSSSSLSTKRGDDISPSSPPPLPISVPPKLPTSSPPLVSKTEKKSPTFSPKLPIKTLQNATSFGGRQSPKQSHALISENKKDADVVEPTKPPRISVNLNDTKKTRSITPMETDTFSPVNVVFNDPLPEQKAFITKPSKHNVVPEKKDKEMVGDLLKSLADVRNKHDAESKTVNSRTAGKNYGAGHANLANLDSDKEKVERRTKEKSDESAVKFPDKLPQRPKSSFVAGRAEAFLQDVKTESRDDKNKTNSDIKTAKDDNLGVKTKVTEKNVVTTKIVDDDAPAWKKQLDQRKAERQRPKSVDILSNIAKTDDKPDWQKEAQRRMAARKAGFVDPEKVKMDEVTHPKKIADKNTNSIEPSVRPQTPPQKKAADAIDKFVSIPAKDTDNDKNEAKLQPKEKRRILPVPLETKDESPTRQKEEKKKITVGARFVFEEIETAPKKPQRQAGPPKSPGPPRPPQPVVNKPGKHHMSAYQIQKELDKIDSKLSELELKGRSLEDSIRKAKEEEEEDDLMINWFKLVSDKNDLVRQEADIIYLCHEQELEAEQTLIEQQLRELVDKPDLNKSVEDQKEEEYLMTKYLDIVNRRSNIVDSMDEDRLRYLAEDKDIEKMLKDKAFKQPPVTIVEASKQKQKKKRKDKRLGFSKDSRDGKLKKDKKKSKLL